MTTDEIARLAPEQLAKHRAEFFEWLHNPAPQPEEIWAECELCGHSVSPQARTLGTSVHGECWQRLAPIGRERLAAKLGVTYSAACDSDDKRT